METGNSAVLARVTWDQEPEDSRQHIGREEPLEWGVGSRSEIYRSQSFTL